MLPVKRTVASMLSALLGCSLGEKLAATWEAALGEAHINELGSEFPPSKPLS